MFKLTLVKYRKYKDEIETLVEELGREPYPEEVKIQLDLQTSKEAELLLEFINTDQFVDEDPDKYELIIKRGISNYELKKLRIKRGISQIELMKETGINSATICSIENCRKYPDKKQRRKLAEFFGVREELLFPEWLGFVADELSSCQTEKIVEVGKLRLDSAEVLGLEAPDTPNLSNIIEGAKLKKIADEVLTLREQKIISTRYGFEDGVSKTLEEVGNEFGATRERIRQIEQKAFEKIKYYLNHNQSNEN